MNSTEFLSDSQLIIPGWIPLKGLWPLSCTALHWAARQSQSIWDTWQGEQEKEGKREEEKEGEGGEGGGGEGGEGGDGGE